MDLEKKPTIQSGERRERSLNNETKGMKQKHYDFVNCGDHLFFTFIRRSRQLFCLFLLTKLTFVKQKCS